MPETTTDPIHDKAVAAAQAVFDRAMRLYSPHQHVVVEAVDAVAAVYAEQSTESARRLDAVHDMLTRIDDGDEDAFTTPESTAEYVVGRYRAVAASEAWASDEITRLRAELTAIADLAYRAGTGDAATDALQAIQTRARSAAHLTAISAR